VLDKIRFNSIILGLLNGCYTSVNTTDSPVLALFHNLLPEAVISFRSVDIVDPLARVKRRVSQLESRSSVYKAEHPGSPAVSHGPRAPERATHGSVWLCNKLTVRSTRLNTTSKRNAMLTCKGAKRCYRLSFKILNVLWEWVTCVAISSVSRNSDTTAVSAPFATSDCAMSIKVFRVKNADVALRPRPNNLSLFHPEK
jgi:hypothetical protein